MITSKLLSYKGVFNSDYLGENIINLLDKTFVIPDSFRMRAYMVEPEYTARPDLLAMDLYGSEQYAELICKLNGISNPYELKEGMYLAIPAVEESDNFIFQPDPDWTEKKSAAAISGSKQYISELAIAINSANTNKQTKTNLAKAKDKHFNIDTSARIIIY